MSKKQNVFRNIFTAGIQGEFEQSDVRKALIFNLFTLVGTTFAFLFGFKDLKAGKVALGSFVLVIGVLFVAALIDFRIRKNVKFSAFATPLLLFTPYIFLLISGGTVEVIFWAFNFPMVAYFMLGRKTGTIAASLLILIYLAFFMFPLSNMANFTADFALKFVSGYVMVMVLMAVFEKIRSTIYKKLMFANSEKADYITEAELQTEELQAQAENLQTSNAELEKLTFVAEHTDNIVQIISPNGDIEWVNNAFSKTYQLSFEDYTQRYGKNIFSDNRASATKKAFRKCVAEKKTISYQAKAKLGLEKNIVTQVMLSPTLNIKNEVEKIIAIETDITVLKQAEMKILKQSAEMYQQKEKFEQQNAEVQAQNQLLSIQNENIKAGIATAKTIQQTILPKQEILDKEYQNFILFRPKDIVSGDFYWYAQCPDKEYSFTVVADCTGHGVPGAFMSMISNRLLNEIVIVNKIHDPKEILTQLHNKIVQELKQKTTTNNDGMDLCLCKINSTNKQHIKITYCGAKRPLLIVKNNGEIQIVKGTRKSIGGTQVKRRVVEFENKELTIAHGDTIYLTTDGYIDQNNEARLRFGTPQLLIVLQEISKLDLPSQKAILEAILEKYMGHLSQRDDITIMGIEF